LRGSESGEKPTPLTLRKPPQDIVFPYDPIPEILQQRKTNFPLTAIFAPLKFNGFALLEIKSLKN
jgi:hypothetical protein